MRRVPLVVLAFLLLAPAARADGLETLQDLAKRHLRPAPLVPTSAPRPLSDLRTTLDTGVGRGRRGYGLRLVHYASGGPDAVIALERGAYGSMRAALRDHRTTRHFISGVIEWGTDSCTSNGFPAAARGGSAAFLMLPLRHGAFSMPLTEGWNGSLSGTVSAPAVSVALQGSGTFDAVACDTGPMSVSADRRDPL